MCWWFGRAEFQVCTSALTHGDGDAIVSALRLQFTLCQAGQGRCALIEMQV